MFSSFILQYLSFGNSFFERNYTRLLIGFIILLTSIFSFFFFGEIRNLTTLCVLPLVNNGFSLSSFFLSLLSFLWIGAQFPQEKFLSYGRILTLHYYFLLMCILFSLVKFHFLFTSSSLIAARLWIRFISLIDVLTVSRGRSLPLQYSLWTLTAAQSLFQKCCPRFSLDFLQEHER